MLFTYLQVESETNKTNFFECEAPAMKVNEKSCLPWIREIDNLSSKVKFQINFVGITMPVPMKLN